ncbi:hypothetical protein LOTGIDRAFT_157696 [Lottia gigantea]|uniref:EF-hand domain-containing protein n=1 Tax=Lottia gigantea TaxID=225164 RepID=V4A950_LOTGI|nr:hypothetical protein LOTGIDRAFT_157696 [Lottia gigantea]ESP00489.1 hypothetical protein LOTGIDRAFT_157696 [Lottia gigantea]
MRITQSMVSCWLLLSQFQKPLTPFRFIIRHTIRRLHNFNLFDVMTSLQDVINQRIRWGKREVREADVAAVLSDDEIKSRLGVAHENLAEVYEVYDVNEDGVITVAEFEAVSSILENILKEGGVSNPIVALQDRSARRRRRTIDDDKTNLKDHLTPP